MRQTNLGTFGPVSRLTIGGGGIGQIWGETDSAEAVATLRAALDGGITLIDTAPMYRHCEAVVAEAFAGRLPDGVRITSKVRLGSPPPDEVGARVRQSVEASLAAMRLERIDLFFLHTNICRDDYVYAVRPDRQDVFATRWSHYAEGFIPAVEALKAEGKIGAWGITGVGVPETVIAALAHTPRPAVVQAVTNLLDSAGGMRSYAEPARPRDIIAAAVRNGVGVMGIRAVQAGALTSAIDRDLPDAHAEARDFDRAGPWRALCRELGEDPAALAHRYALSMDGVDTVVLGVKNRAELDQCLAAEAAGPLAAELIARIDGLGLREAAA
ncbi:MAG TPA: aldo/keto reductase [Caulobacteraceae bacterium]|nr:aldo/keto reductase [Caulobacteraceae bacterium]